MYTHLLNSVTGVLTFYIYCTHNLTGCYFSLLNILTDVIFLWLSASDCSCNSICHMVLFQSYFWWWQLISIHTQKHDFIHFKYNNIIIIVNIFYNFRSIHVYKLHHNRHTKTHTVKSDFFKQSSHKISELIVYRSFSWQSEFTIKGV